jgi:hypothetical protein
MGKTTSVGLPRPVRWGLWLLAGVVFGVGVGFTFGLTKPRVKN